MQVVIIGNGIAGITAAFAIRKRQPDWRIIVVSGESDFFFSRPALMYLYLGHMQFDDTKPHEDWVWDHERIQRIRAWVTGIDTEAGRVRLDSGSFLPYDKLLLATGSRSNKFGWPGQDLDGVLGLYSLQDLSVIEGHSANLRRGVIVGGGLIGVELAEMLHSRGIAVTILAREESYWDNVMPKAEARLINEVLRSNGVDLRLQTELQEIIDDGSGRACGVITKDGEQIDCQLVGLTAGVSPNLSAVADSAIPTGRGILVDFNLRTQVPGVFAAGDCAEIVTPEGERNRIEQLWYTGQMQGEVAGRVMAGEETVHDRGIWFNSAKFFDLEWQTYGRVPDGISEPEPASDRALFWQHADRRHALRLVLEGGRVVGLNVLGIRYRHRVCERWLAEERDPEYVLDHLGEANFDPEFFHRHEADIVASLKEQRR